MGRIFSRLVFLIIVISLFFVFIGCVKKIERPTQIDYTRYFPLNEGDWRIFSGSMGKSVVTAKTNNIYTFSYYDTLGQLTGWKDFVKGESGTYLKDMIFIGMKGSSVFYEPAFRFSPWNNIIGDTLFQTSTEISLDSMNTHLNVMVGYEILAVETINCEAGVFADCIKVKMDYKAPAGTENKIFDGVTIWWFAPDIGVVKYEAFGETGELLEATIDGISYSKGN